MSEVTSHETQPTAQEPGKGSAAAKARSGPRRTCVGLRVLRLRERQKRRGLRIGSDR